MAKRKQKTVLVEFEIPQIYADRLKAIVRDEGIPQIDHFSDWCRKLVMEYFHDKRRTSVATKRVAINWQLSLYEPMVRFLAGGESIAAFVRRAVWADLQRQGLNRDLSPLPVWKERRVSKPAKKRYKAGEGYHSEDHFHPVAIPEDWAQRISEFWTLSTYLMACTQELLQQETGLLYPAKSTMRELLTEYAEVE